MRDESAWAKNVKKRLRQMGEEYVGHQGRKKERRTVKEVQCNCRYGCLEKFTDEDRQQIFRQYWESGLTGQRNFIHCNVEKKKKRANRRKTESRRQYTIHYHLPHGPNSQKSEVCKQYFLKTLDIGQAVVYTVLEKTKENKGFLLGDQRGKTASRSTPDDARDIIRRHIDTFPRIPSHYCRAQSQREYLDPHLSILKMYSLYTTWCKENGHQVQKEWLYRDVFLKSYNLGFQHPKKDQCDLCEIFKNTVEPDAKMVEEHELHLKRKESARTHKLSDKEHAKKKKK